MNYEGAFSLIPYYSFKAMHNVTDRCLCENYTFQSTVKYIYINHFIVYVLIELFNCSK